MRHHEIFGITASSLFAGEPKTVKACHDVWGDCTVIVCKSKAGKFAASVTCGGKPKEVSIGDTLSMSRESVSDFGEVVAFFSKGELPREVINFTKIWVWK